MKTWLIAVALMVVSSALMAEEPMFRLGVNASFDGGNMRILSVDPNGPGGRLQNENVPRAQLEVNDIIEEVDGRQVGSYDDLVQILNSSPDGYVALTVRDVNSGNSAVWHTMAAPTARNAYEQMRDTYSRAVRNKEIPMTEFFFRDGPQFASSNLTSVLRPLGQNPNGDDVFRHALIAIASIRQDPASSAPLDVFTGATFDSCDKLLSEVFERMSVENDQQRKRQIAEDALRRVGDLLRSSMSDWARRNNKKLTEKATVPTMVTFNVRTSDSNASVQILLASEKTVQLKTHGFVVRPVDEPGTKFLSSSVRWTPLPSENATAYGRYYYRLVRLINGQLVPDKFDENRVIIINQMPADNVIFFQ